MEQHSPNEMPSGAFIEYVFLSKCFSHHLIKCFLFYHSLHLNTYLWILGHILQIRLAFTCLKIIFPRILYPGWRDWNWTQDPTCGPSSKWPKREANQLLMTDYIMLMNPKQSLHCFASLLERALHFCLEPQQVSGHDCRLYIKNGSSTHWFCNSTFKKVNTTTMVGFWLPPWFYYYCLFNAGVYLNKSCMCILQSGDWLAFRARAKWPPEELHGCSCRSASRTISKM